LALQSAPGLFVLDAHGQLQIFRTVAKMDELVKALNERGIRERVLKQNLQANYEVMKDMLKTKFRKLNKSTSAFDTKEEPQGGNTSAGGQDGAAGGGGDAADFADKSNDVAQVRTSTREVESPTTPSPDVHVSVDTTTQNDGKMAQDGSQKASESLPTEQNGLLDVDYPAHATDCERKLLDKVRKDLLEFHSRVCEGDFGVKESEEWMSQALSANTCIGLSACLLKMEESLDHDYLQAPGDAKDLDKFIQGWRETAEKVTSLSQVSLLLWLFDTALRWDESSSKRGGRQARAKRQRSKVQSTLDGGTIKNLEAFAFSGSGSRQAKAKAQAKISHQYESSEEEDEDESGDGQEDEDQSDSESDEGTTSSDEDESNSDSEDDSSSEVEEEEETKPKQKRAKLKVKKPNAAKAKKESVKSKIFVSSSRGGKSKEDLAKCEKIWKVLDKQDEDGWFIQPVDTKILEDYLDIVKNPMDLGTVKDKLALMQYTDAYSFATDVRQIWENCKLYNLDESDVGRAGLALSKRFEGLFSQHFDASK